MLSPWRNLSLLDKIIVGSMSAFLMAGLLVSVCLWNVAFYATWPFVKLLTVWGRVLDRWGKFNRMESE